MALRPPRPPARAEIDRILQRSPWFSRQSKALQSAFVAHGQTVRAEPESWIYDVGEEARGLYGVLTGSVRVLVQTEHVAPSLVAIVGPGAIFGYAAQVLGLSRKTVNRILKAFEAEGLVATGYRSIKIIDPKGLHRIAMSRKE